MGEDQAGATRAVLVVVEGELAGTEYALGPDETLIGRSPGTDVTVHDENASREHAIVAHDPTDGVYTIEDLQSTNGTRVNGKPVRTATLADGDEIQVGHTRLRFFWATRAADE
jgi:pSer/pThr/pTyr-binding forkhead associated (FHA) protein